MGELTCPTPIKEQAAPRRRPEGNPKHSLAFTETLATHDYGQAVGGMTRLVSGYSWLSLFFHLICKQGRTSAVEHLPRHSRYSFDPRH